MSLRLVGLAGSGGLVVALLSSCGDGSDSRTARTAQSTVTTDCIRTPPDSTQVPVVVIEKDIDAGTTAEDAISAGSLVETTIDWGARPSTAAASFGQLATGVAVDDLPANQVAILNQWGLSTDVTLPGSPQTACPG